MIRVVLRVALMLLLGGIGLLARHTWQYSQRRGNLAAMSRSLTASVVTLGLYLFLYLLPVLFTLSPSLSVLGISLIVLDIAVFMASTLLIAWYGQHEPIPYLNESHRPRI